MDPEASFKCPLGGTFLGRQWLIANDSMMIECLWPWQPCQSAQAISGSERTLGQFLSRAPTFILPFLSAVLLLSSLSSLFFFSLFSFFCLLLVNSEECCVSVCVCVSSLSDETDLKLFKTLRNEHETFFEIDRKWLIFIATWRAWSN